jgi:aminopeptidase N
VIQWVFPEDTANAGRLFARSPRMLAIFDSVIGAFPYEKLALVQSSTRFGGMENSSAIFFPERPLADGTARELTVAHEIAHQWFGDAVTERDWPELWLSEGFATYFASVFYEIADGDSAARRVLDEAEVRYMSSAQDAIRPVIDSTIVNLFDLLNRNNYEKGAWVLRMLRARIGDRAFFGGIRAYYAAYRDSTASTDDFRRVMEKAAGQDLGAFFDQWLRRPGYPKVTVAARWNDAAGVLQLDVRQVQRWDPFTFPLEVEAVVDGRAQRRTLDVSARTERFAWPLPGAPRRLRADPRNLVLGPVEVVE